MDKKLRLGTEKLQNEGHSIRRIFLGDDPRYLIDEELTLSGTEIRELADSIYSFAELKDDLLVRRRAEENNK